MVNSSVNVIAAIFFGTCGIAQSVEMLLIGRLIVGIGAGAYPFTLDGLKFQKRKKGLSISHDYIIQYRHVYQFHATLHVRNIYPGDTERSWYISDYI